MTKLHTKQQKLTSRRAVAPVIATLLLVAIAVVGGAIIFVFSQGFFSSAQISGTPQIESLEIVGYDASDVDELRLHDGLCTNGDLPCDSAGFDGTPNDAIAEGERIAVYVQNQSAQRVTLEEVRLAGSEYVFNGTATLPTNGADEGAYFIVLSGNTGGAADAYDGNIGELEAGQEATIIFDLSSAIQTGRDAQFKITTGNGAVFVGTIIAGQQSG